ncbi:hypothetical protein [Euzebya rosea]|uniref:hypothetical protein n=1 Tax=Euzebya rosea TaxID=2052804 RepID=UPI001300B37F|nr:hypothetical protein [Euzebya rosea]
MLIAWRPELPFVSYEGEEIAALDLLGDTSWIRTVIGSEFDAARSVVVQIRDNGLHWDMMRRTTGGFTGEPAVEVLRQIEQEGHILAATQLIAGEARVIEASRTLLELVPEILFGQAAIVESDTLPPRGESGDLNIYYINLGAAQHMAKAVENAHQILRSAPTSADTPVAEGDGVADRDTRNDDQASQDPHLASTEQRETLQSPEPRALGLFVEQMNRLGEESLYQVGMKAEDAFALPQELQSRWVALGAMARDMTRTSALGLSMAGEETSLPGLPLTIVEASTHESGDEARWHLAATVLALRQLLDECGSTQGEQGHTTPGPSESMAWVYNGGLSRLGHSGELLLRAEFELRAKFGLDTSGIEHRPFPALEWANRAKAVGLPEAALLYLNIAVKGLADQGLWPPSVNADEWLRAADHLNRVAKLAADEGLVPVATLLPLLDFWLPVLQRIAARVPIDDYRVDRN